MDSNKDPGHIKRIRQVSYKLNIPEEVIEDALFYTSEYIKNKIAKVEVDRTRLLSKEEFDEILPIIKIPSLGYLRPHYMKYKAMYEQKKKRDDKYKNKEK